MIQRCCSYVCVGGAYDITVQLTPPVFYEHAWEWGLVGVVYFMFFSVFFLLLFPHGVFAFFIGYRLRCHATTCRRCVSYITPLAPDELRTDRLRRWCHCGSCAYNRVLRTTNKIPSCCCGCYYYCGLYLSISYVILRITKPPDNVRHGLQRPSLLREH